MAWVRGSIVVLALIFVLSGKTFAQEDKEKLQNLLKTQQDASLDEILSTANSANVAEIEELDSQIPVSVSSSANGVHTRVKREQDVSYVRIKREEFKVFDALQQLEQMNDQIDRALGSDDLHKIVADAVDEAMSANTVIADLIQQQSQFRVDVMKDVNKLISDSQHEMANTLDEKVALIDKKIADADAAMKKLIEDQNATGTELSEKLQNQLDTIVQSSGIQEAKPVLGRLSLTYLSNPKIPVFRYNQVSMYQWNYGWVANNENSGYGGVHPSQWAHNDYSASQMQGDFKYLRRFLVKKGTADGYGATICSDARQEMQDSSQETGCFVAFRIKNTKGTALTWRPRWYSTSASDWGRSYSSIAVNGNQVDKWECRHNGNWNNCWNPRTITLPANRISTVMFVSFMSHPYTWNGRQSFLMSYFADNSLVLPNGAEYVDDLDTVTGSWKQ
jgi:hypothetical protein